MSNTDQSHLSKLWRHIGKHGEQRASVTTVQNPSVDEGHEMRLKAQVEN